MTAKTWQAPRSSASVVMLPAKIMCVERPVAILNTANAWWCKITFNHDLTPVKSFCGGGVTAPPIFIIKRFVS